ncbi:MAG: ATP-binding cassette domain-containing protein [Parerythrobacter sp.]
MLFDIAFRQGVGQQTTGARELDIAIQTDTPLVALRGPSGAGKTTTLNTIAGLLTPPQGHIRIGGNTLFDSVEGIDLPPARRGCGYVFQDSRLFPHLTVSANLRYGMTPTDPAAFVRIVSLLALEPLLAQRPGILSGGETRRVAIGRALLSSPSVLLLDEPLASLDGARADDILTHIEAVRDTLAVPTIYVSHDAAEISRLTDTVIDIPAMTPPA